MVGGVKKETCMMMMMTQKKHHAKRGRKVFAGKQRLDGLCLAVPFGWRFWLPAHCALALLAWRDVNVGGAGATLAWPTGLVVVAVP